MPVVIKPDPDAQSGKNHDRATSSPSDLLHTTSPAHSFMPILHSSFSSQHDDPGASSTNPASPPFPIVANKNGFVHTVIRAWQQDLHLRIRPDDVWLAILTQFSFFVNRNAEVLRHLFVAHQGRQEVEVYAEDIPPPLVKGDVDVWGLVTQRLATMVKERLVDPNIANIVLPTFTTTTPHDREVAAIAFLGVTQQ